MNIQWSALTFVLLGQCIPIFVADIVGVRIFLLLVAVGLVVQIFGITNTVVLSKNNLIKLSLGLLLFSVVMLIYKIPPFYTAMLLMSTSTLIMVGWINFRSFLNVLSLFRHSNLPLENKLPVLEAIAVQIANFRSSLVAFEDSIQFSLTPKSKTRQWFFAEAIVSFLVHLYRTGIQQSMVAQIRRFSFYREVGQSPALRFNIIVWCLNILMVFGFIFF